MGRHKALEALQPLRQHGVSGGGVSAATTAWPPDHYYNLPLLLAFAVLDQVFEELKEQKVFAVSGRPMLGAKMKASKAHVPSQDYDLVEKGKDARNKLAHEAKLLTKADCLSYVAAIERELTAWRVI